MIKLHGASGSPYVRKVMIALAIKGLEYEHIQQMPFSKDAEFLKISPLGKIPALQDGDFSLSDSSVICEYLDEAYPAVPLYPNKPQAKAQARWLENYAGSRVTELAGGIFFQRFMRPMLKQESDESLVENIIENKLPPVLDYLESQVPAEGFLFGEFSIADIAVVSPFVNASYVAYNLDATRWPTFAAFAERVKAQAAVKSLLAQEAKMFGLA
jgi:glutathione S-transferase